MLRPVTCRAPESSEPGLAAARSRNLWHNRVVSFGLAVSAVCVIALLVAELRGSRLGVWLFKPLASLGFVATALTSGALDTTYGRTVVSGLCLCALGDVLLIPAANGAAFVLGMAAFMLGHAAYSGAFCARVVESWPAFVAFAAMSILAAWVLGWIGARLARPMRWAVGAYMVVISVMVGCAVAASLDTGDARIAVGALAFALSDLSVARERFVQPGFANLLWGLPLYYAAQSVLALSVAAHP